MPKTARESISIGLDFGTESVRALAVSIQTGKELSECTHAYSRGVMDWNLAEFATQDADDYLKSLKTVLQETLKNIDRDAIVGIGVDFTACTMLPAKKDGTPLSRLPEFQKNPHAYVKLWKHHAAQPQADQVNQFARERKEPFLKFYGGGVSSEWMLPKCWEILEKAPEVYQAADRFLEAGDFIVYALTGSYTRNSTAAGYKGLWSAEYGFPNHTFLTTLHPRLGDLLQKWTLSVEAPGIKAGVTTECFSKETGIPAGIPVSIATIDAHSGVPGMGVYQEGALCVIVGTSSCHMALSKEFKPVKGAAGIVKDGILPGFYGIESGQAAVGDAFAWFANRFTKEGFPKLSSEASRLNPGESGLLNLDGWNGNRTPHMNSNLSSVMVGATLETTPAENYRAMMESTAYGTRRIVELHQNAGIPIERLVVCGGLIKDPLFLRIYADVVQLPVTVAASNQAVALGAAILGAHAAKQGDLKTLITQMTRPPRETLSPNLDAKPTYDSLYGMYLEMDEFYWSGKSPLMAKLKNLRSQAKSLNSDQPRSHSL